MRLHRNDQRLSKSDQSIEERISQQFAAGEVYLVSCFWYMILYRLLAVSFPLVVKVTSYRPSSTDA